MVSPANWAIFRCVTPAVAHAIAVKRDVWKLIAPQPALHAPRANSWRPICSGLHYSGISFLKKITSKDVYDAAIAGDELALEVFDFTDSMLGRALAGFMTFSDPEAFVLFGGLTKSGDLLMKPLLESFRQNLMNLWKPDDVAILLSNLKDADAAILGAAATVYRTLK